MAGRFCGRIIGWVLEAQENKQKQKRKRHFCHGMTRKNTEEDRSRDTETGEAAAEELATDEHGKTRKKQKQRHGRGEEEKIF